MTRGVFWDVNHSDRDIEFHVGLYREFFDRVAAKGGIIIGEVKTAAANYNKIYILKYPDKNHLTYAVAPISGQDRLNHLLYHLAVAQASLPGPSADTKVVQYGQTNSYLERTEKDFILWLKRRPKADVTLIGQKVGLEKIFTEMASKNKVAINFKSGEFSSSMFDTADLSYKNKNGKTGLIRVISNVWGDEIRPIAQALSATGHQKILYIGTAGALPHSNYAVGDLLVAKTFISADMHTVINFPSSFSVIPQTSIVKNDAIIGGVISPLLENQKWAQQFAAKGAHGVEVETFHLAKALKEKAQLSVLLMVSDVLFSKHTLDAMDPSMRSEAKNIAFQVLFKEAGIENVAESPAPPENSLEKTMQQIFPPKTSAVYRHFALQTARQNFAGRAPANNLQNILRYWNHFTEKDIEEVILPVSELAMIIKQTAELKNKIFISVPQTFLKGTWHPKKDDLQINFIAIDSNSQKKLNSIIENWQAKSKIRNVAAKSSLSNIETISAMNGNTENKTFALEKFKANRFSFHELYAAGAYMYSGMMQTETSIGEWKFIDSGTSTELKSCPIELFICTL